MDERNWLAERFEAHRPRLRAVAQRLLGATAEADDAVQEAWLRLTRTDPDQVDNLGGWLTTVVARVCLDLLRSRGARREQPLEAGLPDPAAAAGGGPGPEEQALVADAVGPAMLVVLDTLAPAERVAFVLHDLFAVPFDEIAPLVGRSEVAARQLASRARRRVQGRAPEGGGDRARQRAVVQAFLAASREGDFGALLALLDPEVVVRADPAAVAAGADPEVRGAEAAAGTFAGRARAARLALVEGAAGLLWSSGGRPRIAFAFTVADGRITEIRLLADPERLARVEPAPADLD
jgi:RNA polymerase sigma factor (sigma-70 family)